VKRRRWWRSDRNRRGGGVSGGWSWQGRGVGNGEGGGEELKLGRGREEHDQTGSGWRLMAFQAPRWCGAARGRKEGALCPRLRGRGRRRRGGPGRDGRQCGAASNGPRPSGAGGSTIAQQGRAAGRGRCGVGAADRWGWDESRAQCQRRGAGGRGVSEAMRRWGADRRAQTTQSRGAV
jgi:hypothetical protein